MTILFEYEGVLTSEKRLSPIPSGELLLRQLMATNRVVLLCTADRKDVEYYMLVQSLPGIGDILDHSVALADMPLRHRQIELSLSRGAIDFLVAGDPALVAWANAKGLSTLLFSHPTFTLPHARPERGVRAWDELVATVDQRNIARSKEGA